MVSWYERMNFYLEFYVFFYIFSFLFALQNTSMHVLVVTTVVWSIKSLLVHTNWFVTQHHYNNNEGDRFNMHAFKSFWILTKKNIRRMEKNRLMRRDTRPMSHSLSFVLRFSSHTNPSYRGFYASRFQTFACMHRFIRNLILHVFWRKHERPRNGFFFVSHTQHFYAWQSVVRKWMMLATSNLGIIM